MQLVHAIRFEWWKVKEARDEKVQNAMYIEINGKGFNVRRQDINNSLILGVCMVIEKKC